MWYKRDTIFFNKARSPHCLLHTLLAVRPIIFWVRDVSRSK